MEKNALLYTVQEIFSSYLEQNVYKKYRIPEYQRGYKWNKKQIERLLDDINEFDLSTDADRFYCLQNITLVKYSDGICLNVVDGQQRLTTLCIILVCLDAREIVKDKLKYAIRPESHEFLQNFIIMDSIDINMEWDTFIENNERFDHQDIYYLFNAYKIIQEWLRTKFSDENQKKLFKDKVLNHVKLIVNTPETQKEQELFTNLNTGKVNLDGADLVRALLITNVPKDDEQDKVKAVVKLNEKRIRIGLEIDKIAAWWNEKEHQIYFDWVNKEIRTPTTETIDFDSDKYPVDLFYKLFTIFDSVTSNDYHRDISLSYFENPQNGYGDLYRKISEFQRIIEDWFEDVEIYHYIRFIALYGKESKRSDNFKNICQLWKQSTMREEFVQELKKEIFKNVKENITNLSEKDTKTGHIKTKYYDSNDNDINVFIKTFVLLDIVEIIKSYKDEKCNNKLIFLSPEDFISKDEDREHIFPQTPISENDINNEKELEDKINKYFALLEKVLPSDKLDLIKKEYLNHNNANFDWEKFRGDLNKTMDDNMDINAIGNMCLLHQSVNRGYGNDFFAQKKSDIISNLSMGKHIRVHTLSCFNKSFMQENKNGDSWSNSDIIANTEFIDKLFKEYFSDCK